MGLDATLLRVLDHLQADLPRLTEEVTDIVYRKQESYRRSVSRELLAQAISRDMAVTQSVIRSGRPATGEQLSGIMQTIHERFEAGIPMGDLMRAFATYLWRFHYRFLELGTSEGLSSELLRSGSDGMWGLYDAIQANVLTGYRDLELRASLADAQRRADVVRHLLAGEAPPADLLGHDVAYAAIRASRAGGFTETDRQLLQQTGSTPTAPALVAISGDDCLGVVARRPKVPVDAVLGMGPFVPIGEIAASYKVATRACHVAAHLGRVGVQRIEELTWRIAAVDQPGVTEQLRRRFLDPLAAEGDFGRDIEASMRTYLATGQSVPKAAKELILHVNTLRYRLHRFAELTGADLDAIGDLLDITWAFELSDLPPLPRTL